MRYPDNPLLFRPPLRQPPPELYNQFTQNGDCPITKEFYFNEVYSDSSSDDKKKDEKPVLKMSHVNVWIEKWKKDEELNYHDKTLGATLKLFEPYLKNKTATVIGTGEFPWIEAVCYALGSSKITTLDYTRKIYENPQFEWVHVNDYLEDTIKTGKLENYDNAVSFSSIEHSGLGRYGDPLLPNGDFDAVNQVHCMLKPGGLFFLGLPTSSDDSCHIEFNAHRVYGSKRLNLLFKGWKLLAKHLDSTKIHTVFVLQKV